MITDVSDHQLLPAADANIAQHIRIEIYPLVALYRLRDFMQDAQPAASAISLPPPIRLATALFNRNPNELELVPPDLRASCLVVNVLFLIGFVCTVVVINLMIKKPDPIFDSESSRPQALVERGSPQDFEWDPT